VFGHAVDGVINIDTITDFTTGEDVLALSASIFTAFAGQVGNTVGLSDTLSYDSISGGLFYDADGAGVGAALKFAVLGVSAHPASLGASFLIA
jgi:Ca2+-binding RTX toxin-like protein